MPGTFDDLPADDQRELRQLGAFRRHQRGTYLMLEGDRTDHALFICSGRLKIVRTSDEGRESVVAVREAGELVGELNALAGSSAPRAASVVALSDVTVRSIPAVRLREATERQAEAAGYDSLRRVARVLVSYAERNGEVVDGGVRQVTGLTQTDLAGLVAMSPTSVARALAALRSRGLVTTSRRSVAIPDLDAMRRFIG